MNTDSNKFDDLFGVYKNTGTFFRRSNCYVTALKMTNKFVSLVTAALNVVSAENLREHSQQGQTIPTDQVSDGICFTSDTTPPLLSLHKDVLLMIFSFLPLEDLLRACRVCHWWYRLSFDRSLWKSIDLKRFTTRLTDLLDIEMLILKRFCNKIQCLDLSGFTVSEGTLNILASSCKELRVLKLKSVTFTTDTNRGIQLDYADLGAQFPGKLDDLDIRFSQGNSRVYQAIALSLANIKRLGLCDGFLYTLLKSGSLESTIKSMKDLRVLDFSHCLLLKDMTLGLFARCSKLEVLSLRRCPMLTGCSLQELLQSCTNLNTLILDGISIDDNILRRIRWDKSCLTHLELGWCPLITPVGLKYALPRVAKIPNLEYLGLCSIGSGKAMNDEILLQMAGSLSQGHPRKLPLLNLSCSRYITQDGLERLHPFVETMDTTRCPSVKDFPQHVTSNKKHDEQWNIVTSVRGKLTKRQEVFSVGSHFAKFRLFLETPL